jgi:Mn-dependent DtxR family transcriptional regulator
METLNKILLVTLLDLAQNDVPASVARLATELGVTRAQVAVGLNELSERGLVRPDTIRLTFVGLMSAAGLRSAGRSARDVAA